MTRLGLLAGGGALPVELATWRRNAGLPVFVVRLKGFADPALKAFEGADDVEAFVLELLHQVAEERVVAGAGGGDGAGQRGEAAEVGAQRSEVGARDVAGEADGVAAGAAEHVEAAAELGDADVGAVEGLQRRVGEALQADDENRKAGVLAPGRQLHRQGAAAGQKAQPSHDRSSAGTAAGWRRRG